MKRKLDSIGDVGQLTRRRFVGSSRQDQELWSRGGLSFGFNGFVYGSCDFAWYAEEEWIDPYNGQKSYQKPVIVVEATDCLNTRSWGSAQVQRFHHAYGPFLCGINSIYFLNRGRLPIRPYLEAAAYYATLYHRKLGNDAAYLITDDINDIRRLVVLAAKYGTRSPEFQQEVTRILKNMKQYFDATFTRRPYYSNWIRYLRSRAITMMPNGRFVKDLGPKMQSLTDSSQRYGHIIVGEALTTKYLLIGSNLFDSNKDKFYYLFPLITRAELKQLDATLQNDKEWAIVRKAGFPWEIVTLDDLKGIDDKILKEIHFKFRKANLNLVRKEWNETKEYIRNGLRKGTITLKLANNIVPQQKQQRLV
jgi:hypothetical protein